MEKFDSPFGPVELTDERERHIFEFHPDVRAFKGEFVKTLREPEIVRRSKFDPLGRILYRRIPHRKKYLAIVIKINQRNSVLTAYLTDKIQHQPL